MTNRWFRGLLLFVFGFGSALLVTGAVAQGVFEEGEIEEGLIYVDTPDQLKLLSTGKEAYVVLVTRNPGELPQEPVVSFKQGSVVYSKSGLDRLTIYRLTRVAQSGEGFRPCRPDYSDCPWKSPLPPPPPPRVEPTTTFLTSE